MFSHTCILNKILDLIKIYQRRQRLCEILLNACREPEKKVQETKFKLNPNEIEYLLNDATTLTPSFLTEQLTIRHVGYFGHKNCGDDAFKTSLHFQILVLIQKVSLNILGGGDVINDYFVKNVPEKNSIALSVGIPYSDFNVLLKKFKCVYLRNPNDRIYPNCHYAPDFTFLLPSVFGTKNPYEKSKSIGIILSRTYFNAKFPDLYNQFCQEMAKFIDIAIVEKNCTFCFIPFCINEKNSKENDFLIIQDVLQFVKKFGNS